jgi:hypothetical protein
MTPQAALTEVSTKAFVFSHDPNIMSNWFHFKHPSHGTSFALAPFPLRLSMQSAREDKSPELHI